MEQKVCLDTDICIEVIKNTEVGKNTLDVIAKSHVFISTITVFELYTRKTNIDKINFFLDKVDILDFDTRCAKIASKVHNSLKEDGTLIDFRDIFIAATCIENNCVIATLNKKHFERIKGLEILDI